MEDLIEAIKHNDILKAKKATGFLMQERVMALIEERKVKICQSIMVEGEEEEEEEESEEDESDAEANNAQEKKKLKDDKEE